MSVKEFFEISFWRIKKSREKKFSNDHYKYFYTTYFSLPESFYDDKVILDIGCGPRGSLEWADMTRERIGLDPLANQYLKLGAKDHKMTYIKGYAEALPFPNETFDVITSFNSLDHVENLKVVCDEVKRTLKKGGIFLLIVDIHKLPTFTEPQTMSWSFTKDYFTGFEILDEKHLQRVKKTKIYSNLRIDRKVEEGKSTGVLTVMLKKKNSQR